jgi:hypothetical protein
VGPRWHTLRTSRKSSVARVSTARLTVHWPTGPWLGRVADKWANAVKLETVSVASSGSGSESVSLVDMDGEDKLVVARRKLICTDQSLLNGQSILNRITGK